MLLARCWRATSTNTCHTFDISADAGPRQQLVPSQASTHTSHVFAKPKCVHFWLRLSRSKFVDAFREEHKMCKKLWCPNIQLSKHIRLIRELYSFTAIIACSDLS